MRLLAKIFSSFIRINSKFKDIKSSYIFYKIVDSINQGEFTLQCINTSALFYAKITDIVFDTDILQGLHPTQACYIGIEYAWYIKKYELHSKVTKANTERMNQSSLNRYGCYSLCYQNRNGKLCFINNITYEQFIMEPQEIAASKKLISEFDATQAFYIGLLAGLKNNAEEKNRDYLEVKRPNLYLVR